MNVTLAVPVLRVTDVARSMEFYHTTLGFVGDPFPPAPPYAFAILRRGKTELMLRRGSAAGREKPSLYDWDVYLRLDETGYRDLYALCESRGVVLRRMEKMFYGLAEFEIRDPDGYSICLGAPLTDMSDLPSPKV